MDWTWCKSLFASALFKWGHHSSLSSPQLNETHGDPYFTVAPHSPITQQREYLSSGHLNGHWHIWILDVSAQWCRLGAIHNYDIWFGFKRDAMERKWGESTNILMERRQPSPSRNIFTDTGCWKIGIYTSCFLLIWRWIQVFLCRKISLALPNCNYTC